MNQKGFANVLLVVLVAVVGGTVGYFGLTRAITKTGVNSKTKTIVVLAPALSADKKSIMDNNNVLLSVDNAVIRNFFVTDSQLCDSANLSSTPDRKLFCTDIAAYKASTRFASLIVSSNQTKMGYSIETDTLSPDKVLGMLYPNSVSNQVVILTDYSLGNEFLGFSPNGTYLIYQGNCWEGMCGLTIKNAETLATVLNINNPEYVDMRTVNAKFVKWLSNNSVEYTLGTETKQATF